MPREEDRPVQESVLDRLIGDDAEVSAITRARSVRDLKAAVRRDLEWLLNTRAVAYPAAGIAERGARIRLYLRSRATSPRSAPTIRKRALRLRSMIEEAIRIFEPRLMAVQVIESSRPSRGKRASFASPSRPC